MTKKMFLKSLFFVLFIGTVFGVTLIASGESQSDTAELNTVEGLINDLSDLNGANLSDVAISNDIVAKPESHRSEIKLIKSACNWEEAVYTLKPNTGFLLDSIDRTANQQYVEQLKQDKASEPENPVDCSKWQDAK